ncbi:MAG: hypothetical protein AAGG38_02655 [Planctomycetota bacterium]
MMPAPVSRILTPRPPAASRQRGSVLILSLVVVVLLAMIGAGFLQQARLDRVATSRMDNRSQDYEGSILRFIGEILANDIRNNDTDVFFDDEREKYDYPWTLHSVPAPGDPRQVQIDRWLRDYDVTDLENSTVLRVNGGDHYTFGSLIDDSWLASIEPNFTGPVATWRHLTNLTGLGLDLDNTITLPSGAIVPTPYAITSAPAGAPGFNLAHGDTDITLDYMNANPGRFADATGDGILDSRWTWAPLPEQFGLTYVMAVRIIDNSALADINTWSATSNIPAGPGGLGSYASDELAPRWYWPGDLDITQVLIANTAADGDQVADDVLFTQRGMAFDTGTDRSEYTARYRNWLRASRMYDVPSAVGLDDYAIIGSRIERELTPPDPSFREDLTPTGPESYARLTRENESELRWRGGLNRSSDNNTPDAAAPIEAAAPINFWRQDPTVETDLTDTPFTTPQPFYANEPRKRLTLYAGGADFDKANLQHDDGDQIAEVIVDDMDSYPPVAVLGVWPTAQEFADQVGASAIDFRDDDDNADYSGPPRLARVGDRYGMEYLPFISEIYLQARYAASVKAAADAPVTVEDEVTWEHTPGEYLVVIELVNPWPWPIEIGDIELHVGPDTAPDTLWGDLQTLTGLTQLEGHQIVALVREDTNGAGGDNSQVPPSVAKSGNTPAFTVIDITSQVNTNDWPVGGTIGQVSSSDPAATVPVRLLVMADDNNRVNYQTFQASTIPDDLLYQYTAQLPAPKISDGETGYFQYTSIGTADGLSALTVRQEDAETDFFTASNDPDRVFPSDASGFAAVEPGNNAQNLTIGTDYQLGNHAKGATSGATDLPAMTALDDRVADSFDVATAAPAAGDEPFLIGNTDVIYRAGDLARIVLLGPDLTRTVAEVWTDAALNITANSSAPFGFRIRDFMILPEDNFADLNGGNPVFINTGTKPVTHNLELLDRVTTLSPDVDGLDNDGDNRADDLDERLIPGRINLNTATRDMLARALPFDAAADYASASTEKQALIDLIVEARQDPDRNAPRTLSERLAEQPGIAWMGELLEASATGSHPVITPSELFDGSTFVGGTGPLMADFNEYESGVPSARDTIGLGPGPHGNDEFADDREPFVLPFANLNQVASVRSDVFTAYVLVRGYRAADFSAGPVEEYRLIATFDRSVISSIRPLPRLRTVASFLQ